MSKELLLTPVVIARNDKERVLIEPSINSVRMSIAIKQVDEIEHILCHKFSRFMMMRAENFSILRRKPVEVSKVSHSAYYHGNLRNFPCVTGLRHFFPDYQHGKRLDVQAEVGGLCHFLHGGY